MVLFFFFLLFLIIIIIANRDLSGMSTEVFCCSKCRPSPDQLIVALPFLHRYQLLFSFHILLPLIFLSTFLIMFPYPSFTKI